MNLYWHKGFDEGTGTRRDEWAQEDKRECSECPERSWFYRWPHIRKEGTTTFKKYLILCQLFLNKAAEIANMPCIHRLWSQSYTNTYPQTQIHSNIHCIGKLMRKCEPSKIHSREAFSLSNAFCLKTRLCNPNEMRQALLGSLSSLIKHSNRRSCIHESKKNSNFLM